MGPRVRDRLAVWGFGLFWLVPMMVWALLHRPPPLLPRHVAQISNVTCLFSKATPTWNAFYVQVRHREDGPWQQIDPGEHFELQPFGRRTRMHRFVIEWSGPRGQAARDELARWLMRRHVQRHPDSPPIVELRFVGATLRIDADRPPAGGWTQPELSDVPPNHRRVVSVHRPDASRSE
jgi:hypothetical protein